MKKLLLSGLIFFYTVLSFAQMDNPGTISPIPEDFWGVNSWASWKVGNATDVYDCYELSSTWISRYPAPNHSPTACYVYGKVDAPSTYTTSVMNICPTKLQDLYVNLIRFAGTPHDMNEPTRDQVINEIDMIRKVGAEPIIVIPFGQYEDYQNTPSLLTTATNKAYDLLYYINVTMGKKVKYVEIGNEPDLYKTYINLAGNSQNEAHYIAGYFKALAETLRVADNSIKIIGPSLSWYDNNVYSKLLTSTNTDNIIGTDINGYNYLDIVDFHYYPFSGTSAQTYTAVVNDPRGNLAADLSTSSPGLLYYINDANTHRCSCKPLTFSISEINVDYLNPPYTGCSPADVCNDNNGTGTNSFLAGQWMAECYSVILEKGQNQTLGDPSKVSFVTPHSIHESGGDPSKNTDLSLLRYSDPCTTATNKRSTYQHLAMMGRYLKGIYYKSTDNINGTPDYVKEFGTYLASSHVALMIINSQTTAITSYAVNTGSVTPSGASLLVTGNMPVSYTYTNTAGMPARSTHLLIFDCNGNLVKRIEYDSNMSSTYADWNEFNPQSGTLPIYIRMSSATTDCNSGTGTATATLLGGAANYVYAWSSGSTTTTASTSNTVSSLSSGALTVTVSGTTCTAKQVGNVTVGKTALSLTLTPTNANQCIASPTFTVTAGSGTTPYTYLWDNGSTTYSTSNITGVQPGSNTASVYTLTVTDAHGCSNKALATAYGNSSPSISQSCTCLGLPCTLTATSRPGANYQWYYGSQTTGTNSNIFIAHSTGTYSVVISPNLTDMDPCLTKTVSVVCNPPCPCCRNEIDHGINPYENSQLLNNIPNPSSGTTTFNYTLFDDVSTAEIRIIDIYGRLIEKIPVQVGSTNVEFNCSNCATGIYYYSLIQDERKIITKKMIIAE